MNGFQRVIKVLAICFAVFLIVNIFGWIMFGLSFFVNISGKSNIESNEKVENTYSYPEEEYINIDRLDIDISVAGLIIKTGDSLRVETEEVKDNVIVREVNGTLKIEEKSNWFWNKKRLENIVIYIPEQTKLSKIDIDTGGGEIKIDGIYAKAFDIDHGAGRLEISNSIFDEVDIDGGAGETEILDCILNDFKLSAGVGRVKITGEIKGNSEIECGIGELDVSLKGNKEDYKIMAEKGLGSIRIDKIEQGNDTIFGSGKNIIKLEGGIGSIEIDFLN